jgi:hypothetical protein
MSALTVSSMKRNGLAMKSLPPAIMELVRLSKSLKAGDEDDGGFFVLRHGAQFGAEFKAGHAGHVHVEENEVEFFSAAFEGFVRFLDVDGLEMGLFERIDDGAAGNGSSSTTRMLAAGTSCLSGSVPRSNRKPRKSTAAATVRMVEALMFFGFS